MFIAVLLASMTDDQIYASCELAESVLWFLFCNEYTPLMARIRPIRTIDRVQWGEKAVPALNTCPSTLSGVLRRNGRRRTEHTGRKGRKQIVASSDCIIPHLNYR